MDQARDIPTATSLVATMRLVGFTSLALGALSGMLLGLWSFDGPMPVPGVLGEYASASRRLVRLGHIAFFGIGILNILIARELAGFGVNSRIVRLTARTMNAGNVLLPTGLVAAGLYAPLKYFLPLPATSVSVGLCLAAYGAWFAIRQSRSSGPARTPGSERPRRRKSRIPNLQGESQ